MSERGQCRQADVVDDPRALFVGVVEGVPEVVGPGQLEASCPAMEIASRVRQVQRQPDLVATVWPCDHRQDGGGIEDISRDGALVFIGT
jgi:hypothetical protein